MLDQLFDATRHPLTKVWQSALTQAKSFPFLGDLPNGQTQASQGVKDFESFDFDALPPSSNPPPAFSQLPKNPSKPMPLITTTTRLPARCLALAGITTFSLIGLAGAQNTITHWNQQKGVELVAQEQVLTEQQKAGVSIEAEKLAIEQRRLELEGQAQIAEQYSELGVKQASCGDTLAQFYFKPGGDVMEQLNVWGIDWGAPNYNTSQWYPLFDSSGLLFAAIRQNPATGYQEVVPADLQKLDQASICNLNQLFTG
jgi:hypothetical protein